MTPSPKRYFLYARKSTDDPDRQVCSIDDQIAELTQMAERDGLDVVDVLVEKRTAKAPGRPVFNAMLDRVEAGEAAGILAWHPDRLARNSVDGGRIVFLLDTGTLADLKFPTFAFEPTSSGKFMLSIMLGYSKYYVDSLSDNVKRGIRQRLKNGYWPKPAPIGYVNNRQTRIIEPDPVKAPLVRKAFELYASGGYTLVRLRETVNALGLTKAGKPLAVSVYQYVLNNPIYYGVIRHEGEHYPGKHQAIVPKELFDAAQEVMACRSKPNVQAPVHCLYRGVFRCGECGAGITSEVQKGHEYLRCTKKLRPCAQPYVRIEEVTRQVEEQLGRFALPDDVADVMLAELERERADHERVRKETLGLIRDKIAVVDARLARLMDAYLAEAVPLDEYKRAKNRLVGERRDLEDKLVAATKRQTSWLEPAIRFVKAAKSTDFWAQARTDQERRDMLKRVGSNLTIRDRTIRLAPRDAWKTVVDSHGFAGRPGPARPAGAPLAPESRDLASKSRPLVAVRTFFKDTLGQHVTL